MIRVGIIYLALLATGNVFAVDAGVPSGARIPPEGASLLEGIVTEKPPLPVPAPPPAGVNSLEEEADGAPTYKEKPKAPPLPEFRLREHFLTVNESIRGRQAMLSNRSREYKSLILGGEVPKHRFSYITAEEGEVGFFPKSVWQAFGEDKLNAFLAEARRYKSKGIKKEEKQKLDKESDLDLNKAPMCFCRYAKNTEEVYFFIGTRAIETKGNLGDTTVGEARTKKLLYQCRKSVEDFADILHWHGGYCHPRSMDLLVNDMNKSALQTKQK